MPLHPKSPLKPCIAPCATTHRSPAPPAKSAEHLAFTAELWRWSGGGAASWYFLTLPEEPAACIKFLSGKRRGFGSKRVTATIGATTWATSVFPDSKSGSYLLPIKADVRKAERLAAGSSANVRLNLAAPEPLQAARGRRSK